MKKLINLLAIFLISMITFGQSNFNLTVIQASDVPQAVKDQQNAKFPNINVEKWEKNTFTKKAGKPSEWFVAVFKENNNRVRSRYANDGKAISATTYYLAAGIPQNIKDDAVSKYPGFTVTSGEKIKNFNSGKEYYRVRLKKGSSKLVLYYNPDGTEVKKENLPDEITGGESQDN